MYKVPFIRYEGLGLAAPQIGVPLRILCVQHTKEQMSYTSERFNTERGYELIPQRILINPTLTILDQESVTYRESCISIHGYSALVPRSKSILVKAYNENGEFFEWALKDWPARILQHEIDHLNGELFIDKMVSESFSFDYWRAVNNRNGNFSLSYGGMESYKNLISKIFYPKWLSRRNRG